jgi:2,5-diamino-6-(ribosylamino)-4(3H)-pyrimidinone 5'-phosphate reductase
MELSEEKTTPKVIMHDSVSIDGSFVGFEYSMELMGIHYKIADTFNDKVRIFGSTTALKAIEMFGGFTEETEADFAKACKCVDLTYWAVTDSKGLLEGKLHYFRRSEYCRDVVVLITEQTPKSYVEYLASRNYDYYTISENRVDLKSALKILSEKYNSENIMIDSGRELTNAFLNEGLVDEISLLIVPEIVGNKSQNLFSNVLQKLSLELIKIQQFPFGFVWNLYKVKKT